MSDICQCPTCNTPHAPADREFVVIRDLQAELKAARVMKQMVGEVCNLFFGREAGEDVKPEVRARMGFKVLSELRDFYDRHK